jgi:7-carboxy-7-deazaguanine synthase
MLTERNYWLAELCKQHVFRLSPRLHIDLWGGERGR